MSSVSSILADAAALSAVERYELAMAILDTLREPLGAPKAKRGRKAAASADGEPKAKREPTAWDKLRAQVSATIKGVDGFKQQHVMKFASSIKGKPEMTSEAMLAEYTAWLATDASSVSSGGSKASKPSKSSKPELTEDEKAAKRKAAAEKRKATIAAKKAAEAVAAAPPPPAVATPFDDEEELEDDDDVTVMASWEHDFGDGAKMYARFEKDGKVYIYETDCETYLGELKGKKKLKIDASTPNPRA
jgi:hypothetical protein